MASWNFKLDVKDVFHDESRSFEERRDEVVKRIRAAEFYDGDEWLTEIVLGLEESTNEMTFNYHWDGLYDWADDNRVWVATF